MKAFKVFNSNWTCRGFQYEVGETYVEKVNPILCDTGFHFCKKLSECFNYYSFDPSNKVAEIEALGNITEGDDKCCTNKIKIVKEIKWHEVLELVNTGKGNAGLSNSGSDNSGHYNSGYRNSGSDNSGSYNSGNRNSGHYNSGHYNSGDSNSGDYCSGDFNLSENESGCFCTKPHKIRIFDKKTDMTLEEWRNSRAFSLLIKFDNWTTEWVHKANMTEQEKEQNDGYKTTCGYLKNRDVINASQDWWNRLSDEDKQCIRKIPNFDAKKFEKIMGIMGAK